MFGKNNCHQSSDLFRSYCTFFESIGQPTNLVTMLDYYENMMADKVPGYENSSKSSIGKLISILLTNIQYLLPGEAVIAAEAQLLVQIIDINLTQSIQAANRQRKLILYAFSFSLVMVSLLIWFRVLLKLNESSSDFEKVIQMMPPSLIFSSSSLKKYIKKHTDNMESM